MSFRDDIADDFSSLVEDQETITITLNRLQPEDVIVENAKRSAMSKSIKIYWQLEAEENDLQFGFAVNKFATVINSNDIRRDDFITDSSGRRYFIISARLLTLRTRWRILVREKK